MADIGQVLATGGTAIVAVSVGAGLTYLFGSMNRRHQEAREDATRWHNTKLEAYTSFFKVVYQHADLSEQFSEQFKRLAEDFDYATVVEDHRRLAEDIDRAFMALHAAVAPIRIVGSTEAQEAVLGLLKRIRDMDEGRSDTSKWNQSIATFLAAARKDLGRPD